ncbi:MAG: hypothetical protein IT379_21115 [Deltaproteobacteria bacterium]|nr:hypothetical protein [Deltaproteobacteria bacterium]
MDPRLVSRALVALLVAFLAVPAAVSAQSADDEDADETEPTDDSEGEGAEGEEAEGEESEGEEAEGEESEGEESEGGEAEGEGGEAEGEGGGGADREGQGEGETEEESSDQAAPMPEWAGTLRYEDRAETRESRFLVPPVLIESGPGWRRTAVFPFFFHEQDRQGFTLVVPPYYRHRRSRNREADVVFPLFARVRDGEDMTFATPLGWYHGGPDRFDLGIVPLVFAGRREDRSYTVIPPLLTFSARSRRSAFTLAGPFWRTRSRDNVDWGVFPLVWGGTDGPARHLVVPPLFWHFADDDDGTSTTVVGPVYHATTPRRTSFGLAPLAFHTHTRDSTSTTVLPLFHHAYRQRRDHLTLITPVFGIDSADDHSTLITPVYQRHRGDTYVDASAPIVWSWGDDRAGTANWLVLPFVYHGTRPGASTTVTPLFAQWHREGQYDTLVTPLFGSWRSRTRDAAGLWIFPSLQISHNERSSTFNLHPLVYSETGRSWRHLVLAPIYWDFEDIEDNYRSTVVFPVFWRFRTPRSTTTLTLNAYHRETRRRGEEGWEFHFFPLFAFGSPRSGDHWWNVLYGLVGYERRGEYARMQLLYAPITVDRPAARTASRARRASPR